MNFKFFNHNKDGFTLIELIIGLALTTLLLAALFTLLSTSLKVWSLGSSKTEVQHTARYCIDVLTRDLQFATQITKNSDTNLELSTNKYQSKNPTINFTYEKTGNIGTLYRTMDKNKQPISGGDNSPISIDEFTFTTQGTPPKTVLIKIAAKDINTNQEFIIETAVSSMLIK